MSPEDKKALVRRYIHEPWVQGRLETFDELCGPNYVLHAPDGRSAGVQELKNVVAANRRAMPDLQHTVHDMITEGDKVVFRRTMRGTHQGEYDGIPATGKTVVTNGITIVRLEDGKVVEDWFESGNPDFKTQVA